MEATIAKIKQLISDGEKRTRDHRNEAVDFEPGLRDPHAEDKALYYEGWTDGLKRALMVCEGKG